MVPDLAQAAMADPREVCPGSFNTGTQTAANWMFQWSWQGLEEPVGSAGIDMEHAARMAVLALSNSLASSSLDPSPRGGWWPYAGLDARMDPSLAAGAEPTTMRWIPSDFREQVEIRFLSASSRVLGTAAALSGGGLADPLATPAAAAAARQASSSPGSERSGESESVAEGDEEELEDSGSSASSERTVGVPPASAAEVLVEVVAPAAPVPTLLAARPAAASVVGSVHLFSDLAGNRVSVAAAAGSSSSAVLVAGSPASVEAALSGGAFAAGAAMEWEAETPRSAAAVADALGLPCFPEERDIAQAASQEAASKADIIARLKRDMAATQQKLSELEEGLGAATPPPAVVAGTAPGSGTSSAGSMAVPSVSGSLAPVPTGSVAADTPAKEMSKVAPAKARPKAVASGSASSSVGSDWLLPPASSGSGGGCGMQQAGWGNNIGRKLLSLIRWGGKLSGRGQRVFITKVQHFRVDFQGIEDVHRWAKLADLAVEIRCSQEHLAREIHRVQVESGNILRIHTLVRVAYHTVEVWVGARMVDRKFPSREAAWYAAPVVVSDEVRGRFLRMHSQDLCTVAAAFVHWESAQLFSLGTIPAGAGILRLVAGGQAESALLTLGGPNLGTCPRTHPLAGDVLDEWWAQTVALGGPDSPGPDVGSFEQSAWRPRAEAPSPHTPAGEAAGRTEEAAQPVAEGVGTGTSSTSAAAASEHRPQGVVVRLLDWAGVGRLAKTKAISPAPAVEVLESPTAAGSPSLPLGLLSRAACGGPVAQEKLQPPAPPPGSGVPAVATAQACGTPEALMQVGVQSAVGGHFLGGPAAGMPASSASGPAPLPAGAFSAESRVSAARKRRAPSPSPPPVPRSGGGKVVRSKKNKMDKVDRASKVGAAASAAVPTPAVPAAPPAARSRSVATSSAPGLAPPSGALAARAAASVRSPSVVSLAPAEVVVRNRETKESKSKKHKGKHRRRSPVEDLKSVHSVSEDGSAGGMRGRRRRHPSR